jgi:transposase
MCPVWPDNVDFRWTDNVGRYKILDEDPFSGCLFLFRNKSGKTLTLLNYDGQGFWLARKRLSKGRFRWWPSSERTALTLEAYQVQVLMAAWWRLVGTQDAARFEG